MNLLTDLPQTLIEERDRTTGMVNLVNKFKVEWGTSLKEFFLFWQRWNPSYFHIIMLFANIYSYSWLNGWTKMAEIFCETHGCPVVDGCIARNSR